MQENWLTSLDADTRVRVEKLSQTLRDLGDTTPDLGAYSEVTENIPQLARFLVLRHLWPHTIDRYRDKTSWILSWIGQAERDSSGTFADAGRALRRMIDAGITPEDIGSVARAIAYEAVFDVLDTIDEGRDPHVSEPGWALMELNGDGELTGRTVAALHEDILTMNPSQKD